MPGGQPTKYKPEYCELLKTHCAKGLSFETFGATIGVSRDNVYEWAKVHAEFSEAKKQALDLAQLYFENVGNEGMTGKNMKFNATPWIFSMKNRFKWHDNIQLTNPDKHTTAEEDDKLADSMIEVAKIEAELP